MQIKIIGISVLTLLTLIACDSKERVKAPAKVPVEKPVSQAPAATGHKIVVKDVIQAPSYTYLKVSEQGQEYWIATTKQPIETGTILNYEQGLEMKNFTSKELDRTFDSIWFVSQLRGDADTPAKQDGALSPYGGSAAAPDADIHVEKLADGVDIATLYANRSDYADKTVRIRGQVTKFNPNIMGRNWVHIQDGTRSGEAFDVTITTPAMVQPGDVVVFQGKLALNKDFGAGYRYDLIIEEAELLAEH